jgi:hypothetical protein
VIKFHPRLLESTAGFVVALSMGVTTVSAQSFIPGVSYFGRSNYIQYVAGDLPMIISAPHGGSLTPSEIPDRDCTGISD